MVTDFEACEQFEGFAASQEHAIVSHVGVGHLQLVQEGIESSRFGVKARSCCKSALPLQTLMVYHIMHFTYCAC